MLSFSNLGNMGRLGNQLFQIASTIGSAKNNNEDYYFPEWYYNKFFKNKIPSAKYFPENIFQEKTFYYSEIKIKNSDLSGYFQSEKYWENHRDLIIEQFEFIEELIDEEKWNKIEKDCSIHVRRTDYIQKQEYHPLQKIRYYQESIDLMKKENCNNFLIFSDDINWCKNNFIGEEFIFVEGQTEIQDLCLMSRCKNNIIANSSFSWWAAYLNKNKQKIIISPLEWFGPEYKNYNTSDLYCGGWIRK